MKVPDGLGEALLKAEWVLDMLPGMSILWQPGFQA
jgi:hypothetical protein